MRVLDGLDGVIVTGGRDVDPAGYGQASPPADRRPEPDPGARRFEDAIIDAAIEKELPLLGICVGAQVLNVALGGTLISTCPT